MFSTLETSGISCRFNGARNILDRVDEAAKKALDKATMIHTNAERTIVPDIDTSLQLAEARNILEQVSEASISYFTCEQSVTCKQLLEKMFLFSVMFFNGEFNS